MFTSTALAAAAPFAHPAMGFGFGLLFIIGHVIWFLIIVAIIVALVRGGRRRRAWAASGMGPWGRGGWGGHGSHGGWWAAGQASRAAEATLAERFAQGDIDEKEYRARLEVLRANAPQPPFGPGAGPTGSAGPQQ